MSQYSDLKRALQQHLDWHGARISFLALFLLALLKVKTVNMSQLCLGFEGTVLPESSYKRLQRFFAGFELNYTQLATLIVSWMQIPSGWVLSLDSHQLGIRHAQLQHSDLRHCASRCRFSGFVVDARQEGEFS